MKTRSTKSVSLYQDRPLPENPHQARRFASLDLSGLDHTDFADSALRAFLVLCLLGSMLVCGWQLGAPVLTSVNCSTATPTASIQTAPHAASVSADQGACSASLALR